MSILPDEEASAPDACTGEAGGSPPADAQPAPTTRYGGSPDSHPVSPAGSTSTAGSPTILKNIAALVGGEMSARAIAFIATAYLARRLDPEGFGILGLAAALAGYLLVAVSTGINDLGAREVARRPRDAGAIAGGVILARLGMAVFAMLLLSLITWQIDKPAIVKTVIVLTGLSFFSLALDTSWVYKGLERNRWVAYALTFSQVIYLGAVLLVVTRPADVVFVPIAQFMGEITAALLLGIPLFRGRRVVLRPMEGFRLLFASRFLALSKLLRTLILTFDVLLLSFMLGEADVGLYTAAYRVCFVLLAVAAAVQAAHLPALTRSTSVGADAVRDVIRGTFTHSALIGAPLVIGGMVTARPLLAAFFGPDYAAGAMAFRWLLLSLGFVFIRTILHNLFVVYDHTKLEVRILAAAVALNIGLNLLLIPIYGIAGAGFATAMAEGFIVAAGLRALANTGIRLDLEPLARPLGAAILMAVILAAIGSGWVLPLQLLGGAVLYVIALAMLGGLPATTIAYVANWRSARNGRDSRE